MVRDVDDGVIPEAVGRLNTRPVAGRGITGLLDERRVLLVRRWGEIDVEGRQPHQPVARAAREHALLREDHGLLVDGMRDVAQTGVPVTG